MALASLRIWGYTWVMAERDEITTNWDDMFVVFEALQAALDLASATGDARTWELVDDALAVVWPMVVRRDLPPVE